VLCKDLTIKELAESQERPGADSLRRDEPCNDPDRIRAYPVG
jgi:hypothetical protein